MAMTTRRALLASVPAVVATTALPTIAAAAEPATPIRKLFGEWKAANVAYNASGLPDEHPESLALFDAIMEIEDELLECVPQSVEDFALMILVAHDAAGPGDGANVVALVKMAHEIAGIPLPARLSSEPDWAWHHSGAG